MTPRTVCLLANFAGAGKGTALATITASLQREHNPLVDKKPFCVSIGNLLLEFQKQPCYTCIAKTQRSARMIEWAASSTLLGIHLHQHEVFGSDCTIIIDGVRDKLQIDFLQSLAQSGLIPRLALIGIESRRDLCFERLHKRTIEDKRADLSFEDQLGTPDPKKINRKLDWEFQVYNDSKRHIAKTLIEDMQAFDYDICQNIGTREEFQSQIERVCKKIF